MFEFFESVLGFFEIVWSFVQNIIESFVILFQVILSTVTIPPLLVGLVPPFVGVGILSMFGIGIAKLIVGRDN